MKSLTRSNIVASLLAFNGGFVDMAGFLGLNGLFTAHITGNFVTLGHALVEGSHGIMGKILALPQFIAAIALARLAGIALRIRSINAGRTIADFAIDGADAAIEAGFAGCPLTEPSPPQSDKKNRSARV